MSESIVLFTTRSGHSRALALDLASRLGSDAREIADLVGRKGLFGWLRAGRQAAMRRATPIGDPGVDLRAVGTVVLVQPSWAASVCPPIRTWILAHAEELHGKRLALLVSCYGTPAAVSRQAFESEFAPELGPLAACAAVEQKGGQEARARVLDDFIAELKRK
jgi:hypothetical protein